MKGCCGNCEYFLKWKNDSIGGGVCEFTDARTKPDYGSYCKNRKSIKYKRSHINGWKCWMNSPIEMHEKYGKDWVK